MQSNIYTHINTQSHTQHPGTRHTVLLPAKLSHSNPTVCLSSALSHRGCTTEVETGQPEIIKRLKLQRMFHIHQLLRYVGYPIVECKQRQAVSRPVSFHYDSMLGCIYPSIAPCLFSNILKTDKMKQESNL